jgi:cytidylate kinase
MKAKFVIASVVALAILIGTVSGYTASETFSTKSIKGDFDLKGKIDEAKFEAKAESMGMTVEEFKAFLVEEFEEKAKEMGMTVEEYKEYLAQQEKEKYNEFEEKAKEMKKKKNIMNSRKKQKKWV